MKRNRVIYLLVVCGLILAALVSRRFGHRLPGFVALYAGDTLWGTMVFCVFGFIFIRWSTLRLWGVALLFCYAAEVSQLYHAPWIDSIRSYKLGGLLLGYSFLWSDVVCYTVGVTLGAVGERILGRR